MIATYHSIQIYHTHYSDLIHIISPQYLLYNRELPTWLPFFSGIVVWNFLVSIHKYLYSLLFMKNLMSSVFTLFCFLWFDILLNMYVLHQNIQLWNIKSKIYCFLAHISLKHKTWKKKYYSCFLHIFSFIAYIYWIFELILYLFIFNQ